MPGALSIKKHDIGQAVPDSDAAYPQWQEQLKLFTVKQ
jgi:hypothetical protein